MLKCCRLLLLNTWGVCVSLCTELCTRYPWQQRLHKLQLQATLCVSFSQYLFWKSLPIPFYWFTSEGSHKEGNRPRASPAEGRDYVTLIVFCGRGERKEFMMSESKKVFPNVHRGEWKAYTTVEPTQATRLRSRSSAVWVSHCREDNSVLPHGSHTDERFHWAVNSSPADRRIMEKL